MGHTRAKIWKDGAQYTAQLARTSRIFLDGLIPSKYQPTNIDQEMLGISGGGSKITVEYVRNASLKWVAVARIGLKLGGNEATRFRIMFKT